jgi:hypothetical protein
MVRDLILLVSMSAAAVAQVAVPAPANRISNSAPESPGTAAALSSIGSTAENARVDLARLRIDKWKAGGDVKQDATSRAQSLQRNLAEALPALVQAVRQNPQSVNAAFKLYRNVNVLYDVMSNLAESAGAFGPKEDYAALARDLEQFDAERHALADTLDIMTAQKDAEVARMQQEVRQAQVESAPPKKIIIDDEAPAKKTAKKPSKKKVAPKPPQ